MCTRTHTLLFPAAGVVPTSSRHIALNNIELCVSNRCRCTVTYTMCLHSAPARRAAAGSVDAWRRTSLCDSLHRPSWWGTAGWARPPCWFSTTRASSSRGPSLLQSALVSQWVHSSSPLNLLLHSPPFPSPPPCHCYGLFALKTWQRSKILCSSSAAWISAALSHLLTAFITIHNTVCVCVVCVLCCVHCCR